MFVLLELTLEVERRKRNFLSLGKVAQPQEAGTVSRKAKQRGRNEMENEKGRRKIKIYDHLHILLKILLFAQKLVFV